MCHQQTLHFLIQMQDRSHSHKLKVVMLQLEIPEEHYSQFQVNIRCHERSNRRRCSVEKGVLKNFANFTGKYLRQRLFFNKVPGLGLQLY